MNLQKRLELVPSPRSYISESVKSIPMAHKEYEKHLRQLELECRNHIKVEQQMKLHIEALQEKLTTQKKEVERLNKVISHQVEENSKVSERLNQIITRQEQDLKSAADMYNQLDSKHKDLNEENKSFVQRCTELQKQYDKIKAENTVMRKQKQQQAMVAVFEEN